MPILEGKLDTNRVAQGMAQSADISYKKTTQTGSSLEKLMKIKRALLLGIFSMTAMAISGCGEYEIVKKVVKKEFVYEEQVIVSRGYANISAQPSGNPSQQRLMAIRASKIDAYRNLTEIVFGQNIDATTTVEQMVATNDAVRAHVQGVIIGARIVSITPIGEDSYETRLELGQEQVNQIREMFL